MNATRWTARAATAVSLSALWLLVADQEARAAIVPLYQFSANDAVWTPQGNGIYTVPTSAESYVNEIWERPVEDNKWTDSGGTRTNTSPGGTGKYYAYNDLEFARFGVGTSGGLGADTTPMDYLFILWEVVGGFVDSQGSIDNGIGLKGHYYFYFELPNQTSRAVEITDATGLDPNFGDPDNIGKINLYKEAVEGAVYGTAITTTQENGVGFSTGMKSVAGQVRANTATSVVEVAVKLSDLGLTLADFSTFDWAYAGVATSNPSSASTDLFANDQYPEAKGSGQEYDTVRFSQRTTPGGDPVAPEASSFLIWALIAGCTTAFARHRMT